MVKATIWISGVKYTAKGEDDTTAFDGLNKRWQQHCDNDANSDRRQLNKLAEHIRYDNG